MSELEQVAGGERVGPGGSMPPRSPEPSARAGRQTFWAVVGRAYWRSMMNRVATLWVLAIVALTVLVPFIASEAPYTAVLAHVTKEGATVWAREWPLFRDLTRVDWVWVVWGVAAVAYWALHRRADRPEREIEQVRSRRAWALLVVAGTAVAVSVGIGLFKTDFLDVRDYHQLSRSGEIRGALFPPLRWGYAEPEPLEAGLLYTKPTWLLPAPDARQQGADGHWHLLGTDGNGRDVLARLLWGARVVLEIGLVSELIALVIGATYGALMGYFVGKVDIVGMRVVEVVEAVPLLFLLITFVAIFGRHLFMIMVIIGVTGWTGIARFVRAEFLRIRQADYVAAAKALGLPLQNVLFRHMLPNGLTPVIVSVTFGVAGNIVSESILSFLGIGVEPPTSSWGAMLNEAGNPGQVFRWWLALAPGLLIFLTVFAYNIIGEGLRDAIDPRTNKVE
jgi:peptide/nickel transport system permease protein